MKTGLSPVFFIITNKNDGFVYAIVYYSPAFANLCSKINSVSGVSKC